MNKILRAVLGALLLGYIATAFLAPTAQATGRAECVSLPSKILRRSVPYCVLLPPSYDSEKTRHYPILYLLHGLGDNDQMLIHSGGMNLVEDLWEQHQLGEFLIVTPAAGASFYINSSDGHSRYEDFFLREFMPGVEKRYRAESARNSRGIAGISMGGYGALHIAFQPSPTLRSGGRTQPRPDRKTAQRQRAGFSPTERTPRPQQCIWLTLRRRILETK